MVRFIASRKSGAGFFSFLVKLTWIFLSRNGHQQWSAVRPTDGFQRFRMQQHPDGRFFQHVHPHASQQHFFLFPSVPEIRNGHHLQHVLLQLGRVQVRRRGNKPPPLYCSMPRSHDSVVSTFVGVVGAVKSEQRQKRRSRVQLRRFRLTKKKELQILWCFVWIV